LFTNLPYSPPCVDATDCHGENKLSRGYFGAAPWNDDWSPRYNIATTQPVPVIRQHPKEPIRQISSILWGGRGCPRLSSRTALK
jgi:hypothetical protein